MICEKCKIGVINPVPGQACPVCGSTDDFLDSLDIELREKSVRGADWDAFAEKVFTHIEDYTVPQYGDKPNDNVESWTAEDCIKQVKKYLNRFGKQQRTGEEKLDLIKIAHYAQLAHDKM